MHECHLASAVCTVIDDVEGGLVLFILVAQSLAEVTGNSSVEKKQACSAAVVQPHKAAAV